MRWLENRIPPPVVGAVAAVAMWLLAQWLPVLKFSLAAPWLICLVVASVGGIISTAGAREFRRVRTTVNPLYPERATSIVTTGVFRFTRNPMYVGIALVLFGLFLAFGSLSAFIGLPAFGWYITRFQIVPEERVLEAKFGNEYKAYLTRVRRWL